LSVLTAVKEVLIYSNEEKKFILLAALCGRVVGWIGGVLHL
jgi:hypothetical protein